MSTTKPSIDLPRSLPYEDVSNFCGLVDLTNLIIADTIWARRKKARMSETKLADTMNRNRNFVRLVESGRYSVTIAEFKSLAGALNLDHLEFAEEVLEEIVMASEAVTAIAQPGISVIEPLAQVDAQDDTEESVREDTQEASKECAQEQVGVQVGVQDDVEESAQEDTQEESNECAQDDAEEDSQVCEQEDVEEDAEGCVQEDAKKEKGTYRKTLRNRRKMPPKERRKDTKGNQANVQESAHENAAGADSEEPAPDGE